MTGTPLTLPEELLLLALEPARGRFLNNARYLRYGLAGAALADKEEAGRITVGGGDRITVTHPLPLGDPVLDGALAALPGPDKRGRGIKAERWVRRAGARPNAPWEARAGLDLADADVAGLPAAVRVAGEDPGAEGWAAAAEPVAERDHARLAVDGEPLRGVAPPRRRLRRA